MMRGTKRTAGLVRLVSKLLIVIGSVLGARATCF